MRKELIYPLIVGAVTTVIAIMLPKYIVVDSKNKESINITRNEINISRDAFDLISEQHDFSTKIFDFDKIGWKPYYKDIYKTIDRYFTSVFAPNGLYFTEYVIRNSGDSVIEMTMELGENYGAVISRNNETTYLAGSSTPAKLKSFPYDPIRVLAMSASKNSYTAPKLLFSTGNENYDVVGEKPQYPNTTFFGIDPQKNELLTLLTYFISAVALFAFAVSGIVALFAVNDLRFVSRYTPDEEFVKMVRKLRYLKRNNPKRMRQIIREYRRLHGETDHGFDTYDPASK